MTPLFFGTAERRLFGLYTPARAHVPSAKSVVLCHPWGQEYLWAHRSMRQLAALLSAAGHHVLRFDYFGTGDSAGEMFDATLTGWEHDIEMAMQELKDTSGASHVVLVGLRLGGTLAAQVAARTKTVDTLVMWDPVVSGPEYLAELRDNEFERQRRGGNYLPRAAAVGGGHEVLGFPLTDKLAQDIRKIDLPALADVLPSPSFVIASAPLASHSLLRDRLVTLQRGNIEQVESLSPWINHHNLGAGAIPAKALDRIVHLVS